MPDKKTLILLAAISTLIVFVTAPMISFSQQQAPQSNSDNGLTTFEEEELAANQEGANTTTTTTNQTTTATQGNVTNQTPANVTAPPANVTAPPANVTAPPANETLEAQQLEEQRMALTDDFRNNITSGDTKVLAVMVSDQSGVPVEQEQRDIDPLGLISFAHGGSMRIQHPDYASGDNLTSTLYPGGKLSFMFENLTIQAPDDIDVIFISTDANDMRSPIVIDDTGEDNSFRLPDQLKDGQSYLMLVSMHWPDLHHDVVMGIDGKAKDLQ